MRNFTLLRLTVLILALSACVSSFKTTAEYDKATNFGAYKTFMFLPWRDDVSTHISKEAKDIQQPGDETSPGLKRQGH